MPVLIVKSGASAGRRFEFERSVEVGRSRTAGLSIDEPTISRRHAAFLLDEKGCWVEDLQSQNGTAVNGKVIGKQTLVHDGDELRIGGVYFDFSWKQGPARRRDSVVMLKEGDLGLVEAEQAGDPVVSFLRDARENASVTAISKRLRLIYDIALTIGQTLDEDRMASLLLEKLFEVFPKAERAFLLVSNGGELAPGAVRTRTGESTEISVSQTLVWDVIRNRRGVLSRDAIADERFQLNKSLSLHGVRSILCVPMIAREEVCGILGLDSTAINSFERDDIALLLGIGSQAALALANARLHQQLLGQQLLEQDLALAKRIQARFLPATPPEVDGYDFRAYYLSALEVGGDYYDFLELPGNRVGVALGDVSGKGVSAALYMVRLSTEVRYRSAGESNPGDILTRVNSSVITDVEDGMFITSLLLALDPSTGRLSVASAGHMPPLLRRNDGQIVELATPRNTPLGVVAGATFAQSEFQLKAGDTILIYTDGVSEAADSQDRFFAEERVREAMRNSDGTPEGVVNEVLTAIQKFRGGRPQNDDITLICFGLGSRRLPREAPTIPVVAFRQKDE